MNAAITASQVRHFDAIIIGTGQAGPPMAARFAEAGKTVAIIERGKFGGTCVNTGCTPTKTLVASAYAIHLSLIHIWYRLISRMRMRRKQLRTPDHPLSLVIVEPILTRLKAGYDGMPCRRRMI